MKEMDYKETYEKALGVAKTYHDCNNGKPFSCNAVGLTEAIFPELGESEDERIRNAIKLLIKMKEDDSIGLEPVYGASYKEMSSWLEKQGEQPNKVSIWKHWKDGIAGNGDNVPTYLIKNGSTYSISSCLGFECDYIQLSELDSLMVEKQGEQKSTWNEEDEKSLKLSLENLIELKNRFGEKYGKVGDCIHWLESLKERMKGE